jgi:hypothetical protein
MSAKKSAAKLAHKLAKKAAKKVPHKAAKKTAPGHDLRRAYEHLNRVRILHGALAQEPLAQLETLTKLAQNALTAGDNKAAADLLRAGEHLAFGVLASAEGDPSVTAPLTEAAHVEFDRLLEKADAHWNEREGAAPRGTGSVYKFLVSEAKAARKAGALHRALEFARGAEALAHAAAGPLRLGSGEGRGGQLLP